MSQIALSKQPARWNQRWRHSLKLRLTTMFVLLALAMAAVFLGGMQRVFSVGWRDAARPLVTDYVDRLVADLGTPPDITRAQALAARLPIAVRIDGPQVNWQSDNDQPQPNPAVPLERPVVITPMRGAPESLNFGSGKSCNRAIFLGGDDSSTCISH